MNAEPQSRSAARTMLNKVPEATIFFWIVKIMATTVGETVSDYFNTTLKFGLVGTFFLMKSGKFMHSSLSALAIASRMEILVRTNRRRDA